MQLSRSRDEEELTATRRHLRAKSIQITGQTALPQKSFRWKRVSRLVRVTSWIVPFVQKSKADPRSPQKAFRWNEFRV